MWEGGGCGVSTNEYSRAHGSPNKLCRSNSIFARLAYLHIAAGAAALPLSALRLFRPPLLLLLPPPNVVRRHNTAVRARAVLLRHKDPVVAGLAEQLALMLVNGGGIERLVAFEALDALLVEGLAVGGHEGLGGEDGGVAGGTARGGRGRGPRHGCTGEKNVLLYMSVAGLSRIRIFSIPDPDPH
jgi:hypothetical protein